MASQPRVSVFLLLTAAVLALLNVLVLRRTASAFGLSKRGRRSLAIALAVPFAATLFFRVFAPLLPVDFARPIAVAVSAAELGVLLAAVFLGLAALGGMLVRGVSRLRRGLASPQGTPSALNGAPRAVEGTPGAPKGTPGCPDGYPQCPKGHPPVPGEALRGPSGAPPSAPNDAPATFQGTPGCPENAVAGISGTQGCPENAAAGISGTQGCPENAAAGISGSPGCPENAVAGFSGTLPALTRRSFVERATVGSALLLGGGSAAYGALFGRHDYELSTVPVPIPGLSKAADGFTIVQLSDIHLGQMVGEAEMRAAEELVRKARGDLIVLTGDLVDHDVRYAAHLGRLVRRLSEIRPVVAIPGNHEYYTGIDAVLAALREAGATTLVNQATAMLGERAGFVLAGLDDTWAARHGGGPDLAAALAGVRSEAPRIVLCHNPAVFVETAGHVALQLSGHTHGGQVNVGLRPAEHVLRHGYIAGLYETNGSRIYVNRGFGTAGPAARVGAPPEVTRVVLVSA